MALFLVGRAFPPADRISYIEYKQGSDRLISSPPDSLVGKIKVFIDEKEIPDVSEQMIVLVNESGRNLKDVNIEFDLPNGFAGELLNSAFLPPSGIADSVVERISKTEYKIKSFSSSPNGSYSELYRFSLVTDRPLGEKVHIRVNGDGVRLREYDFLKNRWMGALIASSLIFVFLVIYIWFFWRSYVLGRKNRLKRRQYTAAHLKRSLQIDPSQQKITESLKNSDDAWKKEPENSLFRSFAQYFEKNKNSEKANKEG